MNILLLSDYYPPVDGGTSRHVYLLARALKDRKHNVTVFTSAAYDRPRKTKEEGIEVIRYKGIFQRMPFIFKDPTIMHHPPAKDALIELELEEIISEVSPQVIHTHGWILFSVLGIGKKREIPIVHSLHDYGLICPKKTMMRSNEICSSPFTSKCISCGLDTYGAGIGGIKSIFAYWGVKINSARLKDTHKFISVSSFLRKVFLRHLPFSGSDVIVIPNFLPSRPEKTGASKQLPRDFILFIGALSRHKGVDVLINAYRQLDTQSKLVLIGTPDPSRNYKSTNKIQVLTRVERQLVEQALLECKFLVVPSICPETFSIAAIEAMLHKKAVVATNIGGLPDVVKHGETGLLVPPNDAKALAEATRHLLESPITEEMGKNGYRRAITLFSEDKVLPIIEGVYKEAITDGS